MDVEFDKAILEFRSVETGDIVAQTPSKQQLQAYRKSTTDATIEVQDARQAQAKAESDQRAAEAEAARDTTVEA